jgi:hypothetical protein
VVRSTHKATLSSRRSAFAWAEYSLVFKLALRERSSPSGIREPPLASVPSVWHGRALAMGSVPGSGTAFWRLGEVSAGVLPFLNHPREPCIGVPNSPRVSVYPKG